MAPAAPACDYFFGTASTTIASACVYSGIHLIALLDPLELLGVVNPHIQQ